MTPFSRADGAVSELPLAQSPAGPAQKKSDFLQRSCTAVCKPARAKAVFERQARRTESAVIWVPWSATPVAATRAPVVRTGAKRQGRPASLGPKGRQDVSRGRRPAEALAKAAKPPESVSIKTSPNGAAEGAQALVSFRRNEKSLSPRRGSVGRGEARHVPRPDGLGYNYLGPGGPLTNDTWRHPHVTLSMTNDEIRMSN